MGSWLVAVVVVVGTVTDGLREKKEKTIWLLWINEKRKMWEAITERTVDITGLVDLKPSQCLPAARQ